MNTPPDPTDTEKFRRWAAGWAARTSTAAYVNATSVEPLDQSRELGAILIVALDCLVDNLDDPFARQVLAAMARAPHTVALSNRPTVPPREMIAGACPTCGAPPGRPCTTRAGKRSPSRHADRYRTADQPARTG
jgi:hypothetical protein